jgi:p-hydroxybenzoate 3-monooxygenase
MSPAASPAGVAERTQVGIIGAGPAGLMLSHLLALADIESVVLEQRSRAYCEGRVRAGVLEHDVAQLLEDTGVGERMRREGLIHDGIELRFGRRGHRISFKDLTGRTVRIYGQQEVVKDLIAHRMAEGADIRFEAEDVAIHDHTTDQPLIAYRLDGEQRTLACDVVAGCDGFHGVSRDTIPVKLRTTYSYDFPFAWLGILAKAPPATDELIYCCHERGFALYSMRSLSVSRLYLQVAPDERIEEWPDDRIWAELQVRFEADAGWRVSEGPTLEKSITPARSFVSEPMQHGRLFLAGDASHIVPPTGAKGLNLAIHDVCNLADALIRWYRQADSSLLKGYTDACLTRVWRAQDFSNWMTRLIHVSGDAFEHRLQLARLRYVATSEAAARSLAENYVGLPRYWGRGAI